MKVKYLLIAFILTIILSGYVFLKSDILMIINEKNYDFYNIYKLSNSLISISNKNKSEINEILIYLSFKNNNIHINKYKFSVYQFQNGVYKKNTLLPTFISESVDNVNIEVYKKENKIIFKKLSPRNNFNDYSFLHAFYIFIVSNTIGLIDESPGLFLENNYIDIEKCLKNNDLKNNISNMTKDKIEEELIINIHPNCNITFN